VLAGQRRPARAKLRLLIQFALRAGQDEFAIRMLNDFEARRLLDMKDEGGLMLAFVAKLVVENDESAALDLVHDALRARHRSST
jgi:hypothetical protein